MKIEDSHRPLGIAGVNKQRINRMALHQLHRALGQLVPLDGFRIRRHDLARPGRDGNPLQQQASQIPVGDHANQPPL